MKAAKHHEDEMKRVNNEYVMKRMKLVLMQLWENGNEWVRNDLNVRDELCKLILHKLRDTIYHSDTTDN